MRRILAMAILLTAIGPAEAQDGLECSFLTNQWTDVQFVQFRCQAVVDQPHLDSIEQECKAVNGDQAFYATAQTESDRLDAKSKKVGNDALCAAIRHGLPDYFPH